MPGLLRDWDVVAAVTWIAFRGSPPILLQHLVEQDEAAPVIEAVRARAIGNPRSWQPDLPSLVLPAWRTRALARRWMRAEGLPASEILEKLRSVNPGWVALMLAAEHERQMSEALQALNTAVAHGALQAWARQSSTWTRPDNPQPRQPMPHRYVDETRQIDLDGALSLKDERDGFAFLRDRGIRGLDGEAQCFYDICFRVADVQGLWPASSADIRENLRQVETSKSALARPSNATVKKRLEEYAAARPADLGYPTEKEIEQALAKFDNTRNSSRTQRRTQRKAQWGLPPLGRPKKAADHKPPET